MYPYAEAKTSKPKKSLDHLRIKQVHGGHTVEHHFKSLSHEPEMHVFHVPDQMLEHVAKHMGIEWGAVHGEEGGNEAEYREE